MKSWQLEIDETVMRRSVSSDCNCIGKPLVFRDRLTDLRINDLDVCFRFGAHSFLQLVRLVAMVEVLDGLFEADSDEQTDDDGGDVDEEVAPGVWTVSCGAWTSSMGGLR